MRQLHRTSGGARQTPNASGRPTSPLTGQSSTERVFLSGENTAVTGVTVGAYLFRRSEAVAVTAATEATTAPPTAAPPTAAPPTDGPTADGPTAEGPTAEGPTAF